MTDRSNRRNGTPLCQDYEEAWYRIEDIWAAETGTKLCRGHNLWSQEEMVSHHGPKACPKTTLGLRPCSCRGYHAKNSQFDPFPARMDIIGRDYRRDSWNIGIYQFWILLLVLVQVKRRFGTSGSWKMVRCVTQNRQPDFILGIKAKLTGRIKNDCPTCSGYWTLDGSCEGFDLHIWYRDSWLF